MLTVFTIVLNGQPWIQRILPELIKLNILWRWRIVEGVADPVGCTSWCRPVPARWHERGRSIDGTAAYLDGIRNFPGVTVLRSATPYQGKLHMIREALGAEEHDVVVQLDADELFTATQLETIHGKLMWETAGTFMRFPCDFYVGPSKKIVTRGGYGSMPYEWIRAWRWGPGVQFESHEPPSLNVSGREIPPGVCESLGLRMDHRAYATQAQAEFKEDYYGYAGLTDGWRRLQKTSGPVRLSDYFPQVRDPAVVDDA